MASARWRCASFSFFPPARSTTTRSSHTADDLYSRRDDDDSVDLLLISPAAVVQRRQQMVTYIQNSDDDNNDGAAPSSRSSEKGWWWCFVATLLLSNETVKTTQRLGVSARTSGLCVCTSALSFMVTTLYLSKREEKDLPSKLLLFDLLQTPKKKISLFGGVETPHARDIFFSFIFFLFSVGLLLINPPPPPLPPLNALRA